MSDSIFISYRYGDVAHGAARVKEALAARFGKSAIFMDIDSLLPGLPFEDGLSKALTDCRVLIAIIGDKWLDLLQEKATANERDYVREEIAAALKRKIAVIPVRLGVEGRFPAMPRAAVLPEDIKELARYKKHDVTLEHFDRDAGVLCDVVAKHLEKRPSRVPSRVAARAVGAVLVCGTLIGLMLWSPKTGPKIEPPRDRPAIMIKVARASVVASESKARREAATFLIRVHRRSFLYCSLADPTLTGALILFPHPPSNEPTPWEPFLPGRL